MLLFVSPELSSEREIAIQMSLHHRTHFLSGTFLGKRMPYLDDIWYVGEATVEGVHAELWAWHMLIKYLICIICSKIWIFFCLEHFSGTYALQCTLMIVGMWVGLRHAEFGAWPWSPLELLESMLNNALLPNLVPLMQAEDDGDLHRGQGQQRSNMVNYVLWLPYLGQKNHWCEFRMMTFTEDKGQQRSK